MSRATPAQQRTHPRQQFARLERLGQVVVCTEFETDHAIGRITLGGQHDDRYVGSGAHLAAHVEAVAIGQHQIQQHQIGGMHLEPGQAFAGIFCVRDIEAGVGQIVDDHRRQVTVIFDHQELLWHHRSVPFEAKVIDATG